MGYFHCDFVLQHIVVLITDGQSRDPTGTARQAEKMHADGVEVNGCEPI